MNTIHEAFTLLGLSPDASLREVRSAYRRLVRSWHPDRFSHDSRLQDHAQERLKAINAAYNIARKNIRRATESTAEHDSPFRFDTPIITPRAPVSEQVPPATLRPRHRPVPNIKPRPWVSNVLLCLLGFGCFCVSVTRYGFAPAAFVRFLQVMTIPLACGAVCNFSVTISRRLRLGYFVAVVLCGAVVALDAFTLRDSSSGIAFPTADEESMPAGRGAAGGVPGLEGGSSPFSAPRTAADGPLAPIAPEAPTAPVAPAPLPPSSPVVPRGK